MTPSEHKHLAHRQPPRCDSIISLATACIVLRTPLVPFSKSALACSTSLSLKSQQSFRGGVKEDNLAAMVGPGSLLLAAVLGFGNLGEQTQERSLGKTFTLLVFRFSFLACDLLSAEAPLVTSEEELEGLAREDEGFSNAPCSTWQVPHSGA